MKLVKKYIPIFLLSVITMIAILNSCKKINSPDAEIKNEITALAKAKQNVKEQMEKFGGIPERYEVNQRMQIAYADLDGNIVNSLPSGNNFTSTCAGDLPDYLDLTYYYRLYQCNLGYKIKFGWQISYNNNVVLQNPFNVANRTRGTIRISSASNATLYNNTTFDVQIQDFGVDPNNPDNNIFYVEMTSTALVPISVVNTPGATLRLGAFFATDCSSLDNYSIVPSSVLGLGYTTPLNSNPCTRNDKAWFNIPQPGEDVLTISGYDPLSLCPVYAAGSTPTYQEVEFKLDNGSLWKEFKNFTGLPNLILKPFVSQIDFAKSGPLAPGNYNITIRYRNVKLYPNVAFGVAPIRSQSDYYIFTNACATTAWTEEYYPNILIQ